MNIIESNALTKVYKSKTALNGLTFRIEENKITGLIGRNGAGKTTLLKIIAGLIRETSGDIKVFSENPFNSLKVSANMIFIDDQMSLPTSITLSDILKTAGSFYENWDQELATALFNYFSFQPYQHHDQLSKGMKSTFNMILGLAARCPLTIFDEPTTGMDAAVRKDFYRALLKDYIEHPRTIILSSHLLSEIEDLLEDILLIKDGEKLLHMPVEELKEYAMAVQGQADEVREWVKGKEILFERKVGEDHLLTVVERDNTISSLERARQSGLEISKVSAEDLCVYLTSKTKGGIDDVFNRG